MGLFNKEKLHRLQVKEKKSPKHTIMVVDDEEGMVNILTKLFSAEYNVLSAYDGLEALVAIQAMSNPESLRVIISDHLMPRLTGLRLLEQAAAIIPDTIRIILTGYTGAVRESEFIKRVKIHKIVEKPYNSDELRSTVKYAIEAFDRQRESG